jgi:hypothetical protein
MKLDNRLQNVKEAECAERRQLVSVLDMKISQNQALQISGIQTGRSGTPLEPVPSKDLGDLSALR